MRRRKTQKTTKNTRPIPRNEENRLKTIPRNEENNDRDNTMKTHQSAAGPSSRPPRAGPSTERKARRAVGTIFKIRPILFLKNGSMELPGVGEPLDSSKTPGDLQRS